MRVVVFILLLCNLLFFAFSQGYLGQAENPDAQRLKQQISPEKIRIVPPAVVASSTSSLPSPLPTAASIAPPNAVKAPNMATNAVATSTPPAPSVALACWSWPSLHEKEFEAFQLRLGKQFPELKLSAIPAPPTGAWWVYLPPLSDRKSADEKLREIQKLNIGEALVMTQGNFVHAISFGLFSSEEAANKRAKELLGKGIKDVQVLTRRKEGAYRVDVQGSDSQLEAAKKFSRNTFGELSNQACVSAPAAPKK